MLKIVVCIKQVPDTAEMRIDPVTNTLVRDGVKTIMNPYDSYALETALQLKETIGAHITVYAMGLPGEAFDKNREKLESMAKTLKVG